MTVRAWLATFACGVALFLPLVILVATSHARCRTHHCWHRVSVRRHVEYAWRWFKAHPMPRCTWIPESGSRFGEWQRARYRVRNLSRGATAGGKFQIIRLTWLSNGGRDHDARYPAAYAPPLEQERIARRVLAGQGIHAWERC